MQLGNLLAYQSCLFTRYLTHFGTLSMYLIIADLAFNQIYTEKYGVHPLAMRDKTPYVRKMD